MTQIKYPARSEGCRLKMTTVIPWLTEYEDFPPVEQALPEPNGLLAAGASLSPERLLSAYRRGIFPWFSERQPILWWSPDPRMVLFPEEFRMPRSLAKRLRRHDYEIRIDTAFAEVMHGCAMPRNDSDGTWITQDMISAYCELHRLGHAHSIETWIGGKLAGGLYGMALGRAFYGESMFARVNDASKLAFAHPRADFSRKRTEVVNYASPAAVWQFEDDLFK